LARKDSVDRRRRIVKNWRKIVDQLSLTINKIELPLPAKSDLEEPSFDLVEAIRDALDALVGGWVGIKYLEGDCTAYGDEISRDMDPSEVVLGTASGTSHFLTPPETMQKSH